MLKYAPIALIALLAGCGADVETACQDYVDAVIGCLDEAYADDTTGMIDTLKAGYDNACDGYAGATDKESYDLLTCYADLYNDADCSTADGWTAIDPTTCQ